MCSCQILDVRLMGLYQVTIIFYIITSTLTGRGAAMWLFFFFFVGEKTSLVLNLSTLENEFHLVWCFCGKMNTHIHQYTIQDRVGPVSFRLVDS